VSLFFNSKKRLLLNVLGIGKFYYKINGEIMSVTEVQSILRERGTKFGFSSSEGRKKSSSSKYSKEDIITTISKLSKLGSGFRTVQIGKSVMVISVPTELDNDHMEVMTIAQDVTERTAELGRVSVGMLQ